MKRFNKFLKGFLALAMLLIQLNVSGLVVSANEEVRRNEEIEADEMIYDYDDSYDGEFIDFAPPISDDEDNFVFEVDDEEFYDLIPIEYFNEASDQPLPAISEYVPEMMFADDMLQYLEEEEIFVPIVATNATGSGLVQFVLEPVQASLPNGVTMAQARAAAFNASTMVHPLFANATTNAVATGINGRFGRDAIFLGVSGSRYRIMIAGFVGYVNRTGPANACNGAPCRITVPINNVNHTFEVRMNAVFVPFGNYPTVGAGNVQSASHYVNRNGNLYRYLTNNAANTGGFSRFLTGPAPSWMSRDTRYYSFDGVFFYRNPRNIRANGSGAVNVNNPHFNYFQYLSFRSASRVTAAQLNNAVTDTRIHTLNVSNSVMRNQGAAFVNAQDRYGVNALLTFAKGMHESAAGTSAIARNNNNLFGLGAFDGDPAGGAHRFANVAASVNSLADSWLSRGYLWPGDWRYEGPHAGHKGSGMNVRYATDPYWGQKIAGWAFRVDRTLNNQDINREQLAIRQNTGAVTVTNAGGTALYTANPRGARFFPFLVSGTSGDRLRIVTDAAIVNGVTNRTARFNRTAAVGYIQNSNVWRTNASGWINRNGNWYFYNANGQRHTGWLDRGGSRYFFNSSGVMQTGWVRTGGDWYFLNPRSGVSGHTSSVPHGAMRTGWVSQGGRWYFLNPRSGASGHTRSLPHGAMRDGWVSHNGRWYFLNPRSGASGHTRNLPHGAMRDGWVSHNGRWYYLNPRSGVAGHTRNLPHGVMRTGWVQIGSNWFFMNNSGRMQTGWVRINGVWNYFRSNGRWSHRG